MRLHAHSSTHFPGADVPAYLSSSHEHRVQSQPSIVRSLALGGCVITRSIAGANLHGHRPAVLAPADHSSSPLRPLISLWVLSLVQTTLTAVCPLAHLCKWNNLHCPNAHSEFAGRDPHPLYRTCHPCAAVLRDISAGTSYQTVRLVFRPYTHVLPAS